ncbi:MAG: flippase-like domain-containing protein [Clostridium sp.]|nr:flippase-like domain-containing protein [Clostridium sp.]MCM1475368.1 flippase-like domain-containing protein [Muribaculaceae bacterium]
MTGNVNNSAPSNFPSERPEIKAPLWKRLLSVALRYLLPLALTIILVWYMFRKVNFSDMMEIIRHGVDYWWILFAMGLSVFSHIFRAMRWRLQLRAVGINPPLMALTCSIFGCYALNLVFPRLGEVWRCTYISHRQKASFSTVFGSMMADRLADTVMVALLLVITFIVATSAINSFLVEYPVGRDLLSLFSDWRVWIGVAFFVVLVAILLYAFRYSRGVSKLKRILRQLWTGFAAVAHMKGRSQFLLLTACIWGCYYFQLYVAFFAFPFTRELCAQSSLAFGLVPCLVAFVLSSIGMAIPSNGGLGPWNIAVMFGLAIYGISDAKGTAFSMLQWSGQTVMLIILGIFTMIYISVSSKNHADNIQSNNKSNILTNNKTHVRSR